MMRKPITHAYKIFMYSTQHEHIKDGKESLTCVGWFGALVEEVGPVLEEVFQVS